MEIVLPEGAKKDFSIREAYGFGWRITLANIGFLIGFMILAAIIQYFPALIPESVQKQNPVLAFIIAIISWVMSVVVGIGFVKTGLRLTEGEKGELSDLVAHWRLFFPFLGVSILSGLAIMGGFILLVIPGIIIAIRLQFAPYLFIDQHIGVIESLKKSWEMTKGATLNLGLFGFVGCLINLAGFICLFVGLLVTVPTTLIASVFVYKKFVAAAGAKV